ncbi:MAG: class I SAM-dependent methyltransferase [Pseudonocardia sp.]
MSSQGVGAVERLLRGAHERGGRDPFEWVTDPLRDAPGPVLDVMCGTAGTRTAVAGAWVGVDADAKQLTGAAAAGRGPLVRASPTRLPIASRSVGGVLLALCLPGLHALDALFAELRRVLQPGGTLVAMVPARPNASLAEQRAWRPLGRALGEGDGWPTRSARDHLGWILAAADFAVLGDDRATFWLPLPDEPSAGAFVDGLLAGSLWPPGVPAERATRARQLIQRRSGPGRQMPLPLRRLVARR